MNIDQEVAPGWTRFHNVAQESLSKSVYCAFGLDKDSPLVNQVVSGNNYRTFPRLTAWKDEEGYLYNKVGLSVFDFRGKYGNPPAPRVKLWKSRRGVTIILTCTLRRCTMNRLDVIEDGTAEGKSGPQYSKVCGRIVLQLEKYEILPPPPSHHHDDSTRKSSTKKSTSYTTARKRKRTE
jgi:hypothetical protein